jgi:Rrf2 family transcriptional regulator, iron-sulfur cluster assembly transcription factor
MRLSAQEEYGLRCLLQVAMHPGPEPLQIERIAAAEGLSFEYAAKLMRVLRQGGLVVSTRGAAGGYHLARSADQITLMDVMEVLDGPLFTDAFCAVHSGTAPECVHSTSRCNVRSVWAWVGTALDKVLRQITLHDLASGAAGLSTAMSSVEQQNPWMSAEEAP